MREIKQITKRGSNIKPNEDKITVLENAMWVLDGATGITGSRISNRETDALWYVEEWDKYLRENIYKSKELKEIFKEGLLYVKSKYIKFKGFENLEHVDYPCAAITLVRILDNKLEYYVLGDCSLLYSSGNGKSIEIVNKGLIKLEEIILTEMKKVAIERNISMLEARKECSEVVKNIRKLKNTDEGYWILELNEEAIAKGLYGSLEMKEGANLALLSDGFSQYYDTFNLAKDYREFLSIVSRSKIEELYNNLYKAQEEDSLCNKYSRLKKRDDTSLVYIKF